MSQFSSEEFLKSFLDEASDYLQTIQDRLLALEKPFTGSGAKRRKTSAVQAYEMNEESLFTLNDLLRALHSLKGISGMIGLSQAAELCHAMESILKPTQQNQRGLTAEAANLLIEAAKTLDQIVQTVRDPGIQMPDIQPLRAELEALGSPSLLRQQEETPKRSGEPFQEANQANFDGTGGEDLADLFPLDIAAHLGPGERKKIESAYATSQQVAVAYYAPSKDAASEGTNVNQLRARLSKDAQLIKAVPIISEGVVRFAFVVSSPTIPPRPDLAFLEWQPVIKAKAPTADDGVEKRPAFVHSSAGAAPGTQTLRVDLKRADELMQLVGDLVVTRSRLAETLPRLSGADPNLVETLEESVSKMERQVRRLREAVMRLRLVPLAEVFSRMPLAVRDLSRTSGKKVQLIVEGGDVEIDKALVDRLFDPLMHMVRNAIAHGIETPEERMRAGKPPEGTIRLSGKTEGDHILVAVQDDGKGIDFESVKKQAMAAGWLEEDRPLTGQDVLAFLCRPGFSTQESADMGSGRGMGLFSAAEMAAEVGGSLSFDTQPGGGTRFILRLPLTMSIIEALIVEAGNERYAVPQSLVHEVIEVSAQEITQVSRGELLRYRDRAIPLISLQRAFRLPPQPAERWVGLVAGENDRQAAVLVDRVVGLRETVVRPIADPLIEEPAVSGATELGDGSVALILNIFELIGRPAALA